MAVIELDLDAPPAPPASRPPPRLTRPVGLAVAALLALVLGGAAPTAEPLMFHSAGLIPLSGREPSYLRAGDRVYTLTADAAGKRTAAAWTTSPVREVWRSAVPSVGGNETGMYESFGYLMVFGEKGTAVFDGGTGLLKWRGGYLQPMNRTTAITTRATFRPGAAYDEASGAAGPLYFTEDGRPYTEPPRYTDVEGIAMADGRRLWTSREAGSVFVVDGADGVIVVAADRLTRRDPATGRVLALRALAPGDRAGVFYPELVAGLLLIRTGTWDQGGIVGAYDAGSLRRLWDAPEAPVRGESGTCIGLVCTKERAGLAVRDPGTGAVRWYADRGADLISYGDGVLAANVARPLATRDPATGRQILDLTGWDAAVGDLGRMPLLLTKYDRDARSTAFGLLTAHDSEVRPLGLAGRVVSDCVGGARFVACRVTGGLGVWTYRA